MACKQVLVLLKDRSRVVNFSDGLDELTFQIRKHFADVLPTMEEKIVLQVMCRYEFIAATFGLFDSSFSCMYG